jgi:ABC-type proline/glycine betaine transport system permease subunit
LDNLLYILCLKHILKHLFQILKKEVTQIENLISARFRSFFFYYIKYINNIILMYLWHIVSLSIVHRKKFRTLTVSMMLISLLICFLNEKRWITKLETFVVREVANLMCKLISFFQSLMSCTFIYTILQKKISNMLNL